MSLTPRSYVEAGGGPTYRVHNFRLSTALVGVPPATTTTKCPKQMVELAPLGAGPKIGPVTKESPSISRAACTVNLLSPGVGGRKKTPASDAAACLEDHPFSCFAVVSEEKRTPSSSILPGVGSAWE